MDTIKKAMNLRVHIAPVGFEVDRIVLPAVERRADKVYLMIHNKPAEDKAGPFLEKVESQLRAKGIEYMIEHHDRLDLFNIIRSVRGIIKKEEGNAVYVNLASGSKIQAIAGMMACMMYGQGQRVMPFYVEAKEYKGFGGEQISKGIKDVMDLPSYEIQKPAQKLIDALEIIRSHERLTKKEMASLAEEGELIKVDARKENQSQARFTSLDKNIIQPLRDEWGFIREEKVGRTRWLELTDEGRDAARLLV